jgi:hypothetical protein
MISRWRSPWHKRFVLAAKTGFCWRVRASRNGPLCWRVAGPPAQSHLCWRVT